jgi:hypothetical protein
LPGAVRNPRTLNTPRALLPGTLFLKLKLLGLIILFCHVRLRFFAQVRWEPIREQVQVSEARTVYCALSQANPNSDLAGHLASNSMIGRPGALDKKCSSRKRRSTEKQRLIDNDYNDNKME